MRSPDATTVVSTIVAIIVSGIITAKCAKSTDVEIAALAARVDTVAVEVDTVVHRVSMVGTQVGMIEDLMAGSQVGTVSARTQSNGTIDLWWTTPAGALAPTHYRVLWMRPEAAGEWHQNGGTIYRFRPDAMFGPGAPLTIGKPPFTLASRETYRIQVRAVTCANGRWVRGRWSQPVEVVTEGRGNTHEVRLGTMRAEGCPP